MTNTLTDVERPGLRGSLSLRQVAWLLALLLGCLTPGTRGAESTNAPYQSAGTRAMEARLRKIAADIKPIRHPFANSRRADYFRQRLERAILAPDSQEHLPQLFDLQTQMAVELLNAGRTEEAIDEFNRLIRVLIAKESYSAPNRAQVRTLLATAYLRLAEQQNCLLHHTIDSCILPIQGGGIHRLPEGSRSAIRVLDEQLSEFPDDLRGRWLLNLAYMTLGEHPGRVPPSLLISPAAFASDHDIHRFPDVAGGLGLDLDTLSGSVVMDDFDGDGHLDLMISSRGELDPLRFFHNNADGTFTERTRESGLVGELGGLNLVQADFDNDGKLDLLVLRGAWQGVEGHHPLSLLRNNGNGTFDDVTEASGLLRFHPTQAAVWFDYNNDGWLDLFVGNETTPGDTNRCELFRNNRDGTFTECAREVGLDVVAYVKAVGCGDYDNDGLPDLYISSRGEAKMLFHNDGPQASKPGGAGAPGWHFTDVASKAGVSEPRHSFPTWFFDYDNDGWADIFVCGYGITNVADVAADYLRLPNGGEKPRLYHNNRDGTFTDVTVASHLDRVLIAMAGNFGDLDNDGWLDFYLGTGDPDLATLVPNRMFRNAGGAFFQDVTTSGGFGHLQKGHGIAFGDLDNDGDQDVYEVIGGALEGDHYRNVLFENPGHGNHWVTLKLEGVSSNRSAIGARIRVVTAGETGERSIYKTVGTGASFGGSPLRQEIGLGQAREILRVEIYWPKTGRTQLVKGVEMDRFYRVIEDQAAPVPVVLKSYKLAGLRGDHLHH